MRLHHAGIATRDVDALAERFVALFDGAIVHEETLDDMDVVFVGLEGGATLELLEPTGDGPIADYLDASGLGVHHLAFATDAIDATLDRARDLGVDLVDESPRPGARGHRVAFCHPRSTGGVLVEFVEP
jgi:methylmalonyl-CoA/ethylmalonyl-CoA epimerase